MKRGSFKTQSTMLHTHLREILRWVFFFFFGVNLLILCFVENFMVGHSHFIVVCSYRNFGHCMIWWRIIVWSCWFFWGHFWIVELFDIVKFGQCWWFMKLCIVCSPWYCWMNFDLIFFFFFGYEIMRIWCVGNIFMGMGIFVGIIFMGMEVLWVLFSWVWKFLCQTYVWVIVEWIHGDEGFLGWLGYCLDVLEFWICETAFGVWLIFWGALFY